MENSITPKWLDLIDKTDDELRGILSDLNKQSLRKLTRETILAISEHRNYIEEQREVEQNLYMQLNQIAELARKR